MARMAHIEVPRRKRLMEIAFRFAPWRALASVSENGLLELTIAIRSRVDRSQRGSAPATTP